MGPLCDIWTLFGHIDHPSCLTMWLKRASEALDPRNFRENHPEFLVISFLCPNLRHGVSSESSRLAHQNSLIFFHFGPHPSSQEPSKGSRRPPNGLPKGSFIESNQNLSYGVSSSKFFDCIHFRPHPSPRTPPKRPPKRIISRIQPRHGLWGVIGIVLTSLSNFYDFFSFSTSPVPPGPL